MTASHLCAVPLQLNSYTASVDRILLRAIMAPEGWTAPGTPPPVPTPGLRQNTPPACLPVCLIAWTLPVHPLLAIAAPLYSYCFLCFPHRVLTLWSG